MYYQTIILQIADSCTYQQGGYYLISKMLSLRVILYPSLEYKTVLCYTFLRFLLLMSTINDIMASAPTKATNPAGINIG